MRDIYYNVSVGLTALRSEDISDLMMQDYPDKYEVCKAH